MSFTKLVASQIKPLLARLNDELGKADQQRIQALLDIHTESTLNYATVISTLFPDQPQEKAQNSFRSFRSRFNNAAEEIGVLLKFEVDSHKRSGATERECWFEGEDSKVAQIAQYSKEEASDQNSEKLVPAKGRVIGGGSKETLNEKPLIKLFISYARKDNRDIKKVDAFFDELDECFKASKHFRYERWADWDILIGEKWHDGIMGELDGCDFGLMMVSLPFINSDYIDEHELPKLLNTGRALPVAFKKFDINKFNLKGLQPHQIFRHNDKFYDQFTGVRKSDFIQALFHNIEKRIQKTHEELAIVEVPKKKSPAGLEQLLDAEPAYCSEKAIAEIVKIQATKGFDPNFTEGRGRPVGIKTVVDLVAKEKMEADENAIIATDYLMDWASKEDGPPFCAVLGEYGMGKTTTLKAFTRQLLKQRLENSDLPLPIYIDLREYTWDKRVDFDLNDILSHILKKSWKGGHATSLVSPQDIISYVQENRALMIWDGLDEVIVHMEPKYANDFIRQLWRILPPLKQDKEQNPNAGKMLISCRSHYFRDVNQQNSMLTSEPRDGIKGEDYEALILLPFGQQQIETYLQKSLGISGADLRKTIDLISSVHNLPEMAERPYTLSLIAQHIPQIEELSLRGEVIQGVTLYKSMVENWLARDTGKHQFSPQHKKQLMEYLSAALWRTGQRQWTVDDLDEWLDDFLFGNPRIADAYRNMDREVLKEDLRTATFVTRSDDEYFRFAHTSLQEFFLASYLHRGLYENKRENWQLFSDENSVLPSNETLDFMVQLYASEPQRQTKSKQSMVLWLGEHEPRYHGLLFKVWLILTNCGEVIPYEKLSLSQTDLSYWQIKGTSQLHLIIHDADFSNAKLDHIAFEYIEFQNCNFAHSNLWLAEFQNCQFKNCQFDQSDLTASIWRHNDLTSLNLANCETKHSKWIQNKPHSIIKDKSQLIDKTKLLTHLTIGHRDSINSVVFSNDGRYIASGSADKTIKLWDTSTGEQIQTFAHKSNIESVAFSPDGHSLASGSFDNTIKLWDIKTGNCLDTFIGHSGAVFSVKYSPDSQQLATGSDDSTIKLWDINSAKCINTLKGHSKRVNSVAYSPDNKSVASGSNDKTVKIWDVVTGSCLSSFKQHTNCVVSLDFNPSGSQLVSGSYDKSIKLWNIESGQCLRTFKSGSSYHFSATFSPNGKYIASDGYDDTIKLWEVDTGVLINTFEKHSSTVFSVAFSPDGQYIASGSYDRTVKIWSMTTKQCLHTFEQGFNKIYSIALCPKGQFLVSGSFDKTVKIWDKINGECLHSLKPFSDAVLSLGFSPNGKFIACGSGGGSIKIWNIENREYMHSFNQHSDAVLRLVFSPDGKILASASADKTVKLWDFVTGEHLQTYKPHRSYVTSVAFSPNGQILASSSYDHTVQLYSTFTGESLNTFTEHSGPVTCLSFSQDGRRVISGSADSTIKFWDINTLQVLRSFDKHSRSVNSVELSSDELYLVSGSDDCTVKLWSLETGLCIGTFEEHIDSISSVLFSTNDKQVISGSSDNSIKQWDISSGTLLKSSYHLPNDSAATIDEKTGEIIYGSKEAWRYLCYKDPTENILEATLYPAEIYGPLPGSDE